jgi:7-cyano-7-deazaguanine synthase
MKKVVIGLSGGMDSTTMLALYLEEGLEVHCVSFKYPSKHNPYEMEAAEKIVAFYLGLGYPIFHHIVDVSGIFGMMKSDLLRSGGDIPEGHYADDTMKKTVVPGRNLIFSSVMAGLAEGIGAEMVAIGAHSGDHHIYPDCREDFAKALDLTVFLSSDKKVHVVTPLIHDDKYSILQKGFPLAIPYDLTRTCYKDQPIACGKCGSCMERLEAFEKLGIPDPINYEKV